MDQPDSGPAARYRRIADGFTARAAAVAPNAWSNPAPCAGWVPRDVMRHLVEWFPPFLESGAGIVLSAGPFGRHRSLGRMDRPRLWRPGRVRHA